MPMILVMLRPLGGFTFSLPAEHSGTIITCTVSLAKLKLGEVSHGNSTPGRIYPDPAPGRHCHPGAVVRLAPSRRDESSRGGQPHDVAKQPQANCPRRP